MQEDHARKSRFGQRGIRVIAGLLISTISLAAPGVAVAEEYREVNLEARGCPNCIVTVESMRGTGSNTKFFNQVVPLYGGTGVAIVPSRFSEIAIVVSDKRRRTGWNSRTTVALLYRGFQPGDTVTNEQSKRSKWAQDCLPLTQPETFVTFRVKWDRNPRKYKKTDGTWTKYSLRAWAVPQLAGDGNYTEARRGRTSNQQNGCGFSD